VGAQIVATPRQPVIFEKSLQCFVIRSGR